MINVVEPVKIVELIPVYKNGEPANAIEVAKFRFLSTGDKAGFNVVVGKGLYDIGSLGIYIQPDYCVSDEVSLFESFIKPNGDPKKSRLGKNNRIKAIKFNFTFENSSDPIYSNGILLPINEVNDYLGYESLTENDLQSVLKITKYEEPEPAGKVGLAKGEFPSFMYKTDETVWENQVGQLERVIAAGEPIGITIKHDGSSFTQYVRFNPLTKEYDIGICSRSLEKKTEQHVVVGYVDLDDNKYHKYQLDGVKGWFCDEHEHFISNENLGNYVLEPITEYVPDAWVTLAKRTGLFSKGYQYCVENMVDLAFRGEIFGSGLKGSGNKNNPDASSEPTLMLFGIDDLSSGFSVRNHYGCEHNLKKVAEELGVPYTKHVFEGVVESMDQLHSIVKDIFATEKNEGRLIEGVVIRTLYSNNFSGKYMNNEYSSKL